MKIIDIVELFVNIDDEIKNIISREELKLYLNLKRYKDKETKLNISEYITLIIMYRFSNNKGLKQFWYNYKNSSLFPNMPSYNVFMTWINRLEKLLKYLLDKRLFKLNGQLGIVDSTKIETSKPYRRGKTHREANKGYSSLGEFNGFKLHLLTDTNNQICTYKITKASTHDITAIKENFFVDNTGKILADSGYVSRELYYKLMEKNITLIAKPKSNMMENNELGLGYLPDWNINFKRMYKKRMGIERLFNLFKDSFNLITNKSHSTKGLMVHIFSTLLSNQMLVNNELSFKTI